MRFIQSQLITDRPVGREEIGIKVNISDTQLACDSPDLTVVSLDLIPEFDGPGQYTLHIDVGGRGCRLDGGDNFPILLIAHCKLWTQRKIIGTDLQEDRRWPGYAAQLNPLSLPALHLRAAVAEAGIVGLGGAQFPTSNKLNPDADVKMLILVVK